MQVKIACWEKHVEEAQYQAAVGVSAECFSGDAGRSLVAVDHSRHDATRVKDLQGIPGMLRRNRHKYPGRSSAEAGRLRHHYHETRPIGRTKDDLPADV